MECQTRQKCDEFGITMRELEFTLRLNLGLKRYWKISYQFLLSVKVPIFEQRNDGRDNLLGSLVIAGHYVIPEVRRYNI